MTPGEPHLSEEPNADAAWEVLDAGGAVLGRDPFDEVLDFDPFAARLSPIAIEAVASPGSEPAAVEAPPSTEPERRGPVSKPEPPLFEERRWPAAPPLAEVECEPPASFVERLLGTDERRRLAALQRLVENDLAYDRYGMSPDVLRRAFPLLYALHRAYFRVQSEGHEHVPNRGPVILASNHGGLLPFDGAMLVVDLLLHTDPPRMLRSIVDRRIGTLPWLNVFFARAGQVIGTRENFSGLLEDGQAVLVFPEGAAGIRKTIAQRNQLQSFHAGFVEEALRARAPIVPTAVVGPDDQAPILHDFQSLARRLGLPALPITPTFPLLGPLGLAPYPVRYRIVYGEPIRLHERYSEKAAEEPELVQFLARQVRERVQKLVDRTT